MKINSQCLICQSKISVSGPGAMELFAEWDAAHRHPEVPREGQS